MDLETRFLQTDFISILYLYLCTYNISTKDSFHNLYDGNFQGASCLARSLKVVNEALTSMDLGFNEIRVKNKTTLFFNTVFF